VVVGVVVVGGVVLGLVVGLVGLRAGFLVLVDGGCFDELLVCGGYCCI